MSIKNPGVAFSGTFESARRKISASKYTTRRRMTRSPVRLYGGPLHSHTLWMHDPTSTLPMAHEGQVGRYVMGQWEAL